MSIRVAVYIFLFYAAGLLVGAGIGSERLPSLVNALTGISIGVATILASVVLQRRKT